jgi:hypothetical protein
MMSRKRRTAGTAVYGTVRTVVGEDGGREPSSYPIRRGHSCQPKAQERAAEGIFEPGQHDGSHADRAQTSM